MHGSNALVAIEHDSSQWHCLVLSAHSTISPPGLTICRAWPLRSGCFSLSTWWKRFTRPGIVVFLPAVIVLNPLFTSTHYAVQNLLSHTKQLSGEKSPFNGYINYNYVGSICARYGYWFCKAANCSSSNILGWPWNSLFSKLKSPLWKHRKHSLHDLLDGADSP